MVNVDQAPEDAADPSSLPIEVLAKSLVPLQVAELVGASQVGMSSSSPLLHQSSACFPFVVSTEPGPSRKLLSDLSALNLSLPPLDSVILSVPEFSGPSSSYVMVDPSLPCSRPTVF